MSSAGLFKKKTNFKNIITGILSECPKQTQYFVMPDISVQTVCKSYQQKTKVQSYNLFMKILNDDPLTLKVPITTAADNKFCDIFHSFRQK